MPIGPITMFAIYLVCWWTVLFAVLPRPRRLLPRPAAV